MVTRERLYTSDAGAAVVRAEILRFAQDDNVFWGNGLRTAGSTLSGGFAAGEEFAELVDVGGGDGYQFCVGEDVLRVGHADQSGGDAGGGADELERALGVVFEAERFGDERRGIPRDLALEEG